MWSYISFETEDGCWLWHGTHEKYGYGKIGPIGVYRLTYEELVGPIPDGLTIDHLCRNRGCVNPAHLEPVTASENVRREHAARTHCKWGHEFTLDNTYMRPYGRECKQCIRDRNKTYYYEDRGGRRTNRRKAR